MSFRSSTAVDENPHDIEERNNKFSKVSHSHGGGESNWISVLMLKFYVYKLVEITVPRYKNGPSRIAKHVRRLTPSKYDLIRSRNTPYNLSLWYCRVLLPISSLESQCTNQFNIGKLL